MQTGLVDPVKRAQGIKAYAPDVIARQHDPRSRRTGGPSSPLTAIFPTYQVEGALFDVIAVPANRAAAVDGTSAWYLLRRLRVDADTAQEVTVVGVNTTLLPTDSTAAGSGVSGVAAGNALAWGDTTGISAAIVVGKNLPVQDGVWTNAKCHVAGIELNATGVNERAAIADYISVFSFPTGKLADTTPNKSYDPRAFAPYTQRVTLNETLDVALVVRSSQLTTGGAIKYVCGFGDVRLTLGLMTDQAYPYEGR